MKWGAWLLILLSILSISLAETRHLERGDILKTFKRFIEGKANDYDVYLIKSLAEEINEEPPDYIRSFAKGLLYEKRGKLEEALENYLSSIEKHPDYNPSYFRLNDLLRRIKHPERFRKRLTEIVRRRFEKAPPVILENPEDRYVFLVEKMSQYLLVYRGKHLEGLYSVTTGKDWEDKWREGDKRTPEGIYYFTKFIPPERLPKIYGGVAVVLNYPNPIDKLLGKGGKGIWLHGSDVEDRKNIPFSTRGCVVAGNDDLKSITEKIKLGNTLIGIFKVIPSELRTKDIRKFLKQWKESWEKKDVDRYLSFYSKRFKWKRGGFREWRRYKRRVVGNKKWIKVDVQDLTVLTFSKGDINYYVAEFKQIYRSDKYSDKGIKRLYIIEEDDKLKIIYEEFLKGGELR